MDDIFTNYDHLFNKSIAIKSKIEATQKRLQQVQEQKDQTIQKMKQQIKQRNLFERSMEALKLINNALSRNQIDHLEHLLNESIHTIFFDKDYDLKLTITEQRNTNNLQISLIEHTPDGDVETNLQHNGFGLQCILGFILQVYFIIYYNQAPILFIDEGFTQLSTQYIPFLKSLLTSLTKKYNFIFVLVNHDPRLNDLADRIYEVNNRKSETNSLRNTT